MRAIQKQKQRAAQARKDQQRARYLMRKPLCSEPPRAIKRACPHCGITEVWCDEHQKMHPFIMNFACYGCGLEQHLCDEFGQELQVHCSRCGTIHFVVVDQRGDVTSVTSMRANPAENCNSEPVLPVSLPKFDS